MQYLKAKDLASQWLFENGEQTDHKFARALYYALQVVKQLNFHALRQVQTARLPVRANKTCVLPADYVGLLKLGLERERQLVTLTQTVGLVRDRVAGAAGNPGNGPTGTAQTFPMPLSHAYGTGGGQNAAGHYLLDETLGQLVLAADVPEVDELYIEYVSTGIAATGETVLPAYAEFALLTYLDWKMVEKLRSIPQSEKEALKQEHFRQMRLLVKVKGKVTSKDLREATTNSYSLTVR